MLSSPLITKIIRPMQNLYKIGSALGPRVEAGLDPIEVAKVILKAATSENPDLRYLVGDGAIKLMDMRKNTSDENFRKLIIESILH